MFSRHVESWKFPLFSILLSFKGFNLNEPSLVEEGWKTHIGVVSEFSNTPLQEERGRGWGRIYTRIKLRVLFEPAHVLLNKKLCCYPKKATGEALSFDLGYHHTIVDRFSYRHEKLSGILWRPIRYVKPTLLRSARLSFATSQKSRHHYRSCV